MSVFCEEYGKRVTVVLPSRVARGCKVKTQLCRKPTKDEDCNHCLAKHACAIFLGELRFSLKAWTKSKHRKF